MRFMLFPIILIITFAILFYNTNNWKLSVWKKIGLAVTAAIGALALAAFVMFLIETFLG